MVTCVSPGPAFPGTAYLAFDAGSSRLGSVSLVDREPGVEKRGVAQARQNVAARENLAIIVLAVEKHLLDYFGDRNFTRV